MPYSRLLKINLVLLVLVIICIAASIFALYIGNTKFIGILGIALLALFLVFWRIFSLTRSSTPEKQQIDVDFDMLHRIRPPEK
jgi:general stress protein CsbA